MSAQLRVATYNIHHGADGRDRLDLARIAETLAGLRADVIGLQEVDVAFGERSAFEDQAAGLAEMLGLRGCFGAAIDHAADDGPARGEQHRRQYGLALLTPHEITAHRMRQLPGHPALGPLREPRGLLSATVHPAGQEPLQVHVTHLDHEHRGHRTAQVLRILEHTSALDGPALLLGDLNADPSAAELGPLSAGGWREAAVDLRGAMPRSPVTAKLAAALPFGRSPGRATFPSRLPLLRIDSIWSRGALEATGLEVGASHASDHRPLLATFQRLRAGS